MRVTGISLRIGCVKYLNARPLIAGWGKGDLTLDHPAILCRKLARQELDVALVSSVEYLRNPIYKIVDDVSISSDGPVYSVVVASRGELSQIEQIEIDPASETSVALLRCLLARRGWKAQLVEGGASGTRPTDQLVSAKLLIGDQAIRFRDSHPEYNFWDLGQEWRDDANLPFVYALWLVRPEVSEAKSIARQLRAVRDENQGRIGELIAQEKEFEPEFCRRYYRDNLRFSFGQREKQGLSTFAAACAKQDLIPKRPLEFDLV
ncbi:MAG: hypothetical protein JWO45_305 [Spartobacteria bacterium]|nr:hypothetical protein [Spartobacteria bacterium]